MSAAPDVLEHAIAVEFRLQRSHPVNLALLRVAPVIGILSTLWPTAVVGNDVTYAGFGIVTGATAGLLLCTVAWPACLLVGLGRDIDEQTRLVKLLAGIPNRRSILHSLICSALCCVSLVATAALAGALSGLADWARRDLTDAEPMVRRPDLDLFLVGLAGSLGAAALTAGLILALRSGLRAAGVMATLVGSFVLVLFLVHDPQLRPWLVAHPLAASWSLTYEGRSSQASIEAPEGIALASVLLWLLVLGYGVARARPWIRLTD